MYGFGYQELLLLVVLPGILLLVGPAITYVVLLVGMMLLRSPRRVLIALWILSALLGAVELGARLSRPLSGRLSSRRCSSPPMSHFSGWRGACGSVSG